MRHGIGSTHHHLNCSFGTQPQGLESLPAMSKLKVEALRRCLVEVRLPGAFIDHCLDKLKMESLDDFVNIVTIKDYETEIKTALVDQCDATKDNAQYLSRARSAWRSARTTLLRNEHKKHQGETVEELECALESRAVDTGDLVATVPAYVSSRD